MNITEVRELLARKSSIMTLGGFRPPEDPFASWFGRVRIGRTDEDWPEHDGNSMMPLCQINIAEMPFVPECLSDIKFITVFIAQDELPLGTPNGDGWLLRAYKDVDDLVEIVEPRVEGGVKRFPIKWELCEADFPSREDVTIQLPKNIDDVYFEKFPNQDRSKVGGWPSLIQSEIFWPESSGHPSDPTFAFQINSEDKARWAWSDQGTGYFGRGTGDESDLWTLEWQCF